MRILLYAAVGRCSFARLQHARRSRGVRAGLALGCTVHILLAERQAAASGVDWWADLRDM